MMPVVIDPFIYGDFSHNKVVGAANFSVSTSEHKITCAAGKRMFVLRIHVYRSDSATMDITVKDSANAILRYYCDEAAGTGYFELPTTAGATAAMRISPTKPQILEAGDYLHFQFGAAQSATAVIVADTIEVDIS